jgi:hypothetical protein
MHVVPNLHNKFLYHGYYTVNEGYVLFVFKDPFLRWKERGNTRSWLRMQPTHVTAKQTIFISLPVQEEQNYVINFRFHFQF